MPAMHFAFSIGGRTRIEMHVPRLRMIQIMFVYTRWAPISLRNVEFCSSGAHLTMNITEEYKWRVGLFPH